MNIKYLKERKAELKLNNKMLSDLSGVPLSTLTKITAGFIDNPKLSTLAAIAAALDCSIDTLIDSEPVEDIKNITDEKYIIDTYKQLSEENKNRLKDYINILKVINNEK